VPGGAHVNGQLTVGEDIADGGGLRLAYDALTQSSDGQQRQLTAGEAKTFFLAFAQTWCGVEREESLRASVLNDVHAPRKWRVNGAFADFEPFSREFGCKAGSKMNPGSDQRCVLW
jgi:predicted metalloendopeptidase